MIKMQWSKSEANCWHPWEMKKTEDPFLGSKNLSGHHISLWIAALFAYFSIRQKAGIGFHYLLLFQWANWPAQTLTFFSDKINQQQCLPSSIFETNTASSRRREKIQLAFDGSSTLNMLMFPCPSLLRDGWITNLFLLWRSQSGR